MGSTIVNHLLRLSRSNPHKTAYVVLEDGETTERKISYLELMTGVSTLAVHLHAQQLPGKRALLVYQDILEFIISFLACQYAGMIPVPVPYVKGSMQLIRLSDIIADAQAEVVCCTADTLAYLQQHLHNISSGAHTGIIATDELRQHSVGQSFEGENGYNDIAFLQYTSGSTGNPKGVVVTHKSLLHNQLLIRDAFGGDQDAVIFSWLPFHHDMGLIGNILHAIYIGGSCVLMSPFHFIQKPLRWLTAISRYRVTHSGGPNFAYDLCVNRIQPYELDKLDLSCWKVAFNGSEPVRWDTIRRFSDYFSAARFAEHSFFPCYGLAEATLLVSGARRKASPSMVLLDKVALNNGTLVLMHETGEQAKVVVSAGEIAPEMDVRIVAVHGAAECGALEEGEICIAGDSVTRGYWRKDDQDLFISLNGRSYLRTGDLGFLYDGELYVHGRIKDMLIIRGKNFYPYDIEQLVAQCVAAVEPNGVAVWGTAEPEEHLILAAEIKRSFLKGLQVNETIDAIEKAVIASFGIVPYDILLVTSRSIPRTTSGKLQRAKCRENYVQQAFNLVGSKLGMQQRTGEMHEQQALLSEVMRSGNADAIKAYLLQIIVSRTGSSPAGFPDDTELTAIGLDSLRAMELVNIINRDLSINMDVNKIFQYNTLSGLVKSIEQVLWLKNTQATGEEIII